MTAFTPPEEFAVYLLHQRLSGFPAFSPRLHTRIALRRPGAPRAIIYDRLPLSPRSPATAFRLLTQREACARIRERRTRWPLKYVDSQHIGTTRIALDDLTTFNDAYNAREGFHLARNNCKHYTDQLIQYLLSIKR